MADIPILSDIFGSKPQVAGFQDVNLGQEQLQSLIDNYQLFQDPRLQELGNLYQQYMLAQYAGAGLDLKSLISQGGDVTSTILGQAGQEARGQVPQDVINFVQRQSAFQNLGSGLLGSSAGEANAARNLGLTSLNLIDKGASLLGQAGNAAQRWQQIAGGTILPPSSFLVTPQEQFQATTQNRLIQRQIQQEKYNVAAAPNPIAKGLSDLVAYLTASYIGHGPAGQPPKATDYSGMTGGGPSDVTNPGFYTSSQDQGTAPPEFDASGMQGQVNAAQAATGNQVDPNAIATPVGVPGGVNWGNYFSTPTSPNLYGTTDFNTYAYNPNNPYQNYGF